MINLNLLNCGLYGVLTPSEFLVLYIIENAIGKNNEPKKLYREMIADKSGLSVKQVTRITNSLEEKRFIIKHHHYDKNSQKKDCLYSLNMSLIIPIKEDKNVQENTPKVDTSVPTNIINKNEKEYNNNLKKEIKQNNNIINNFNKTIELETNIINDIDNRKKLEEELKQWWTATIKNN